MGSGSPFMPTASSASRSPSSSAAVGVPAVKPSTLVRQQLVGAGVHAGLAQEVAQGDAEPRRVATGAADVVGHAGQRQGARDQRAGEQVGEGERELAVDHAVDPQRPVRRASAGTRSAASMR